MSLAKVVAIDAICSLGLNSHDIYKRCLEGKSFCNSKGLHPIEFPDSVADESRGFQLASASLKRLLIETNWTLDKLKNCGFVFSTTTSEVDRWESKLDLIESNPNSAQSLEIAEHQKLGNISDQLKEQFGLNGPTTVIASSCSASLQALAIGAQWINDGLVDQCIIGTVEIISELTANGFDSLRLVSKENCKPFDKNRSGINLGEASAFIALEKANAKTEALGYISGWGMTADAYHPTSPHAEGLGSQKSILQALKQSQLEPNEIDWFYAHGTASSANDKAEAIAVGAIFGPQTFVSSSKGHHGHTLAASGLLESVIAIEALKNNLAIPNSFLAEPDPGFNINLNCNHDKKPLRHILKNSLGFGGINCSIVLSTGQKS